jgi:hypothetical protein
MGWGRGLRFESSGTHGAAQSGEMTVNNTFIGGIFGDKFMTDNSVLSAAQLEEWFLATERKNRVLDNMAAAMIADPFNLGNPNFQPLPGSPVFNASYWMTTTSSQFKTMNNEFKVTNYPNPFNGSTNIQLNFNQRCSGENSDF